MRSLLLLLNACALLLLVALSIASAQAETTTPKDDDNNSNNNNASSESSSNIILKKSWTLFQSPGDAAFEKRGTVILEISGDNKVHLELQNDGPDERFRKKQLRFWNTVMNKTGWYQLKLLENDNHSRWPIVTTVPACQLVRANFRDELVLTFDESAHVISMSYMPLVSPLASTKTCEDVKFEEEIPVLDSKISYEMAVPGMTLRTVLPSLQPPAGLKFLTRATAAAGREQQGQQDQKDQPPDNTPFGFLRRYWYFIVPLLLANMFPAEQPSSSQSEQQQQQGATRSGDRSAVAAQGGGGAAATSPRRGGGGGNATPTGGGGARQRRSKRG